MPQTARDVRAPWNCRWARVGHQLIGIPPREDQPRILWLCERPPRVSFYVTDELCSGCEFWEPDRRAED